MSDDLLALFRKTGALLDGHFVLRSGLHSRQYFQCALLLQHPQIAAAVCTQLAEKLREIGCDAIISPALGGIIVGQESGDTWANVTSSLKRNQAARPCAADSRSTGTNDLLWPRMWLRVVDACRKQSISCSRTAESSWR